MGWLIERGLFGSADQQPCVRARGLKPLFRYFGEYENSLNRVQPQVYGWRKAWQKFLCGGAGVV